MNKNRIVTNSAILLTLLANIGCDQISKNIVREKVDYYESISLISNYFTLTKVENDGAFLSLGSALPETIKFILLSGIPVMALAFGVGYMFLRKNISFISMLALSFAIGGGIGNIYDRVVHGSVTDFLHIDLGIVQTGIFNMADVSIMVGMGLFFVQSFFNRRRTIS
ncbi:signal peptidase II [Dyadobacter frigoris]|uniref:Lipoprotein signal peptidase n=1 Tax=Dyadobacter frigoris TaxID=2576211 RepID=A0A4U6D1U8_9BACT|nr:signal peptidase II [Dyadobacter frigoris]TKT90127.1 signal peptidase II [Dyadobacter frigoris]GLU52354.1 lipoprotein signal peptidase [Dyadobacter frigoris]